MYPVLKLAKTDDKNCDKTTGQDETKLKLDSTSSRGTA
jgi:hypothetical protein